ncbi:MAG: dephospho-CoA kinase [Candidatus Azotimanducaceae bacterium]
MTRLVIGLTGGIGTGKSAVSDRFSALGIVVADADVAARAVVAKGTPQLARIEDYFGAEILRPTGDLDRAQLRSRIFGDVTARRWLEALTHRPIMEMLTKELESAQSPYALLVLSAGTGKSPLIHRSLVVDASKEVQRKRVQSRDGSSLEIINNIIAAQPSRETRIALADDVIENNSTPEALDAKVYALHKTYLELASDG